ncbi:RNA polymerase sigma24 factor [Nocardioides sp. OK12]|uniref:RNA polymerase sigma-70 factor (Sigma-E family) n=2 Tax=Nocardioides marinisabuli TaxID=419476 RepID=A0A7Y9EYY5_9ACTN|nr:SigE family RNA polymerase sigma factor [Nocardioides sp. OK12]NYD56478.1 RNA polymerase sigma-70 factor (sigma-E family) [Nocardioides marinisabuli]GHJ59233.1 RNA polymerase sigma24 factor [Nocardioides sp. OK12]
MTPDETADFEAFMAARWAGLVRAAVLMGADLHAAEDLAQAALVDCHRRWGRVQLAQDSAAYVHRILINRMRASRRRRWRSEVPTDPATQRDLQATLSAGGDVAESVSVAHGVREALAGLPLAQRQVVVLRHFCDLSEQQTADVLDVAPGTVKSRLSRAMTALAADPRLVPLRTEAER